MCHWSRPVWGEWIETILNNLVRPGSNRLAPCGASGLKQLLYQPCEDIVNGLAPCGASGLKHWPASRWDRWGQPSRPVWGEWIETNFKRTKSI